MINFNTKKWGVTLAMSVAVFTAVTGSAEPITYTFVNEGYLDGGPDHALGGIGATASVGGVTLTNIDVIGTDGTRLSAGGEIDHYTTVGSSGGLGINSSSEEVATINFESLEAWEFAFSTNVYLVSMVLNSMDSGSSFTLASLTDEFADITVGDGNGTHSLGTNFVTAGSTLNLSFAPGTAGDSARITSITVATSPTDLTEPPESTTNKAYDFELVAGGAVIADRSIGNSANPSVIRVPDWVPLSERAATNAIYYMYFANHTGQHIQLKWAETLESPWTEFNLGGTYNGNARRGVFDTDSDATRDDYDHVFSPDVHVDDVNQQIIMYFHGKNQSSTSTDGGQNVPQQHANFVATSHWGLNFNDPIEAGGEEGYGPVTVTFDGVTREVVLGDVYQHVFEYKGNYYSLSKRAIMAMAPDPSDPWAPPADDPETSKAEPFYMAWTPDTTPSDLWYNDAHPAGQDSYYSPAATFLASSAFENHPNNPHPGMRIFSETEEDNSLRINHCSMNVMPEKEQLEIFFYVREVGASDLYDDVYRIVLDLSNPDFQQWTVAKDDEGQYIFDVVVTDDEIMDAVQSVNPGADPDDFADPSSMGMAAVFVDDDGSKYLFCTYYSAANGGASATSEGQITAIQLFPAYEGKSEWIAYHFPGGYPGNTVDSDLDGYDNWAEFIAGTDPNNPYAVFEINEGNSGEAGFSIDWLSVSGRVYSVYWTDHLTNDWQMVTNGIDYAQSSWADTDHQVGGVGFYRIKVEME
ncbi:hypothetical protein P4C99_03955 [Pontiellaceae bacterium B1224]|nr:hypothetical protein [Pontiellaceae bacterium B1224]